MKLLEQQEKEHINILLDKLFYQYNAANVTGYVMITDLAILAELLNYAPRLNWAHFIGNYSIDCADYQVNYSYYKSKPLKEAVFNIFKIDGKHESLEYKFKITQNRELVTTGILEG